MEIEDLLITEKQREMYRLDPLFNKAINVVFRNSYNLSVVVDTILQLVNMVNEKDKLVQSRTSQTSAKK